MLRKVNDLLGFQLQAIDGYVGKITDIYFDDQNWYLRYFVVNISELIEDQIVLISPLSAGEPNWADKTLPVSLTKSKILNSPELQTDLPISKQYEVALRRYYEWPVYWGENALLDEAQRKNGQSNVEGTELPGDEEVDTEDSEPGVGEEEDEEMMLETNMFSFPREPDEDEISEMEFSTDEQEMTFSTQLRSFRDLVGYKMESSDGECGNLSDLVIEDSEWLTRYMIINTGGVPNGNITLMSLHWLKDISWAMSRIHIALKQQDMLNSPSYDPRKPISNGYEKTLYEFYDTLEY
ncbi:hypothetical protein CHISP_0775 [Chitinispirillum alkaliphilum]|nr:hypothetical protein CHISP_0775 [Chitinispirillum alkaliphilum]